MSASTRHSAHLKGKPTLPYCLSILPLRSSIHSKLALRHCRSLSGFPAQIFLADVDPKLPKLFAKNRDLTISSVISWKNQTGTTYAWTILLFAWLYNSWDDPMKTSLASTSFIVLAWLFACLDASISKLQYSQTSNLPDMISSGWD